MKRAVIVAMMSMFAVAERGRSPSAQRGTDRVRKDFERQRILRGEVEPWVKVAK